MESKRIFIFGGTGFLGRYLEQELKTSGYINVKSIGSSACDLTNQADTNNFIYRFDPEIIINVAATVGGIGANQNSPGRFCYDNLMMGANLINAANLYCKKLEKFVLIGTTCSYGAVPPAIPFREEDMFSGYPEPTNAPYGIAKRAVMTMLQSYRKQYGLHGITVIPTNLFGAGDSLNIETNHVIPALILKILTAKRNNTDVELWGDGSPTRDFLYVEDCARGIRMAMEDYDDTEPVNLGSGIETSILELVGVICEKLNYDNNRVSYLDSMPNGQLRRCLDSSQARDKFGWYATTTLSEGLDKTIDWVEKETSIYG